MKIKRLFVSLILSLSLAIVMMGVLGDGIAVHLVQARPLSLDHSGTISSDETWSAADNPHVLTADVTVASGVTLTLEPGVIVQGAANARLRIDGHLEALGTSTDPITFTSSSGASAGWVGLFFYGEGDRQGTGHLRHATVRYAGYSLSANIYAHSVTAGQVVIESSRVLSVSASGTDYGVYAIGSNVVISDTTFADNGNSTADYALYGTSGSAITVTHSTFQDNAGYAARLEPEGPFVINDNTFSGNGHDRVLLEGSTFAGSNTLPAQTGLESYELENNVTVPVSETLTVEPGVTVMGRANARLRIDGHLEALGTSTDPITFTSSSGASAGWVGLFFYGEGDRQGTGHLRHATVRYAGYSLSANIYAHSVTAGQVVIESSRVLSVSASGTDYGVYAIGSNVVISDTTFADNGNSTADYALYGTSGSAITVTHSTFQDNAGYGLYLNNSQANLTCSTVYTNGSDGVQIANNGIFSTLSSAIYDNAGLGINNTTATTATAIYNWWGQPSGPQHASNPGGAGEEVSDNVLFTPWLKARQCAVDLALSKDDAPDPVIAGTSLTYTLAFTNNGPGTATDVTLTDTLPVSMSLASAQVSQGTGCTETDGDVVCDLGKVALGASAAITLTVDVHPAARGVHDNVATISALQTDHVPTDNTITATTTVTGTTALSLSKADHPDPVIAGNLLTYTLTLTNTGPSSALTTTLVDTLPNGITLETLLSSRGSCSDAGGVVTCNLGHLPPDSQTWITMTGKVDSACLAPLTNTVSATTLNPTTHLTPITETTSINAVADLQLTKTDATDPVLAGLPLTYTLILTNAGPSDATGVVLTDTLTGHVSFNAVGATQGSCDPSGGAITCTLGTLPAGDHVTVTLVVTTTLDGLLTNTAGITSETLDPQLGNNTATEETVVGPAADLALAKHDLLDPVQVGDNLTYTLVITNQGPSLATHVTLTDTLPTGVSYVSATPDQGNCQQTSGIVTCDLGTLTSGASTEIIIVAATSEAQTGRVTNRATVTSNETDRFPANNTVSEDSRILYFIYLPAVLKDINL